MIKQAQDEGGNGGCRIDRRTDRRKLQWLALLGRGGSRDIIETLNPKAYDTHLGPLPSKLGRELPDGRRLPRAVDADDEDDSRGAGQC